MDNRKLLDYLIDYYVNGSGKQGFCGIAAGHISPGKLYILFQGVIFMKPFKCYIVIGFLFVTITGTLAHFLYEWSGNNAIVGLFTPINESIWEHMKLLFFPMLLYAFFIHAKFHKTYSCISSALCFGISIGTLLIPVFFYAYTAIFGKDLFLMDIGIFILSILIAFWLSYKLTLSCTLESHALLFCTVVCILFVCFMVFTYHPPAFRIFADPT